MMLPLMAYAVGCGLTLSVAGTLLERVGAGLGWPRRWIWATTLTVTALFIIGVPWRSPQRLGGNASDGVSGRLLGSDRPTESNAPTPWRQRWRSSSLANAAGVVARLDPLASWAWGLGSLVVLFVYIAGQRTLRRRRRRWHEADLRGFRVLLSDEDGPAVIGVRRMRIVLPAWTLALEPRAIDLILSHEREHQRARDPLLMHLAGIAALVMPWNPPVWWMLARLKLAIEMDCDARVLERSATVASDLAVYGEVLLTVALHHSSRRALITPAMLEHSSTLRKRIAVMSSHQAELSRGRLAAAGSAAAVVLALTYVVPVPSVRAQSAAPTETTLRVPTLEPPRFATRSGPIGEGETVASGAAADRRMASRLVEGPGRAPGTSATVNTPDERPAAPLQREGVEREGGPDSAAQVYEIGGGVSSPVPIRTQDPTYTPDAQRAKIEGEVHLAGVVQTNGLLGQLRVTKSLDPVYGLDQSAIDAAKKWRFKPAIKDGQPVAVHVQLILEFRLRQRTPLPGQGGTEREASPDSATQVYEIGGAVSSPVPIRTQDPAYTPEARQAKIEGEVHLAGVVQTNGLLDQLHVTKSLDALYGLDQSAINAAKKWLFKPATKDGEPVPVHVQLILEFRLR